MKITGDIEFQNIGYGQKERKKERKKKKKPNFRYKVNFFKKFTLKTSSQRLITVNFKNKQKAEHEIFEFTCFYIIIHVMQHENGSSDKETSGDFEKSL